MLALSPLDRISTALILWEWVVKSTRRDVKRTRAVQDSLVLLRDLSCYCPLVFLLFLYHMILHTIVAGFQFEYGKVSFQRFVARQKCFAGVHFCLKASASFLQFGNHFGDVRISTQTSPLHHSFYWKLVLDLQIKETLSIVPDRKQDTNGKYVLLCRSPRLHFHVEGRHPPFARLRRGRCRCVRGWFEVIIYLCRFFMCAPWPCMSLHFL